VHTSPTACVRRWSMPSTSCAVRCVQCGAACGCDT
jgi:hypothetical protein